MEPLEIPPEVLDWLFSLKEGVVITKSTAGDVIVLQGELLRQLGEAIDESGLIPLSVERAREASELNWIQIYRKEKWLDWQNEKK